MKMFFWRNGWAALAAGGLMALVMAPVQAATTVKEKGPGAASKASHGQADRAAPVAKAKLVVASKPVGGKGMAPVTMRIRPAKVTVIPPPVQREPVMLPVAIEDEPSPARPANAVPVRVYALDGHSFYQNGHLIKIQGLPESSVGGEHAKQRLQLMLDSGVVTVLPVGSGAQGEMMAEVRVNGRDVAQAMASQN